MELRDYTRVLVGFKSQPLSSIRRSKGGLRYNCRGCRVVGLYFNITGQLVSGKNTLAFKLTLQPLQKSYIHRLHRCLDNCAPLFKPYVTLLAQGGGPTLQSRIFKTNFRNLFLCTMNELSPQVLQEIVVETGPPLTQLKSVHSEDMKLRSRQGLITGYLYGDPILQLPRKDFEGLNQIVHHRLDLYNVNSAWMVAAVCTALNSSSDRWVPFSVPSSKVVIQLKWDPSLETEKEFRKRARKNFERALFIQKQRHATGVSDNIRKWRKKRRTAWKTSQADSAVLLDLLLSTDALEQARKKGVGYEFRRRQEHMRWFVRYQILGHSMRHIAGTRAVSTVSRQMPLMATTLGLPLREPDITGRLTLGGDNDKANIE